MSHRLFIGMVIWILMQSITAFGQEEDGVIKVGVCEEVPFVIKENRHYSGLCMDLWERIAEDHNRSFEVVELEDQLGLLRALDFGEVDIAINPMHVNTIRLQLFDATQPFFVSSVGVAVSHSKKSQFATFLSNFFSLDFLRVVMLLVFIIFIFGTILWIAERNKNKDQFRPGLIGLFDGLWWSAVTMTTVGYGDKAPKTKVGRVIAMIWMFTAIIIISGFTASIASTLTVKSLNQKIENLDDISKANHVGTIYASSSEEFLKNNNVGVSKKYESVSNALRALAKNEIEVLVYDHEVLDYLIDHLQLSNKVTLLPNTFNQQYKGFMLSKHNENYDWINSAIVRFINQGLWKEELTKYNLASD